MPESIKKWLSVPVLLLLVVGSFTGSAHAQSTRGELAGSVSDSTGAVISGASISATNEATGGKNETKSTSAGSYRFPDLPIGAYTVTVTAAGFGTTTSTGVRVQINSTASLNVTLKPGAVTDTVTVDASGARIETESSDIGGTVTAEQIVELPLALGGVSQFRSAENFVFLVPGTTGPGAGGAQGLNANGVFFGKLGGGQDYGAEVLLDGASITRSENGSSFDETSPSVEALQEFKVTTSTPSAEFGRTTAGFESFVTKNGTNQYHGTGFDLNRNAVYDANRWFENGRLLGCAGNAACIKLYKRGADTQNDYGGTLGGPVTIPHIYNGGDRTFFFFTWEQFRQTLGGLAQSTVPSVAERGGDFSAVLGAPTGVINPCTGQAVIQNQIFDPATTSSAVTATNPQGIPCRQPFAGNIINPLRFSKAAQTLLTGLPTPNDPGISNAPNGGARNNFVTQQAFPLRNTTMTIRIDESISQKSKIFASYNSRDNVRQGVNNLPLPFSNFVPQNFVTHYSRAGWDYTFTPHLLNHLNLGYNRTNSFNYGQTIGGTNFAQQAGIANVVAAGFPRINFDGLDAFSGLSTGSNGDNVDNGIRINDSVSWQKGRHSFKFGIDLRHQAYATVLKSVPTITFLRSETDVARLGNTPQFQSGNSFASMLLGLTDSTNQTAYIHTPRWLSHYIGGFVEDDIKVTSNLTLNLGIRYDVDSPRHEAANATSAFSLTAPDSRANGLPGALVFGANCNCNSAWADTYYKDIAPRVGFAYLLPNSNGKTVIRGGGALINGPLLYGDFGGAMSAGYSVPDNVNSPDGFTPAYQLDAGFPNAFPTAPNLDPAQLDNRSFPAVGGEFISPNMGRPSVTYNWSLQVQQEFARNLIGTIGYIGQEAQNLRSALQNINNIPLSAFSFGDHLNDFITPSSPADGVSAPYPTFNGALYRALRPLPQYDFIATDCCLQNVGHSSYHALVVSLNQSTRFGLHFQASYTWQRNLTDADSALENNQPNEQQDQNIYDHHLEKAVSVQNIPNTFVINYIYALPFGKGKKFLNNNAALDYLVGGWKIGGIQRYQSGQPISFACATGIPGYQNCIRFSKGPAPYQSAAFKRRKLEPSEFNHESWFNPAYTPGVVPLAQAAFIDYNDESKLFRPLNGCLVKGNFTCSYAPYTLGQGIDRVSSNVTTPLWLSEDFSLIKDFPLHERLAFQLKLEALDAFNRHNFNIPDLEPRDTATFGVPSLGAQNMGPRKLQVTGRFTF